jgi:hypothetical protein
MVKAQTTREQAKIAADTGQALFAFACKSGGTFSCDGPISHEIASPLTRLMAMVVADRVPPGELERFVKELEGRG